jgi:tetratricopeptide (TPR) repeat protein
LSLLFALIISGGQLQAQEESLTREDLERVRSEAVHRIQELEGWVQYISQKGTLSEDVQDAIAKIQEDRLFYDSLVTLEDDLFALNPDTMFARDVSVPQYLNDLHLFYTKSADGKSILFSDLRLSDVVKKEYLYLKLYFLTKYRERHKDFNQNYPGRRRIAILRIDREQDGWKVRIAGISLVREKKPDGNPWNEDEFEKEYKPFVKDRKNKLPTFLGASGDSIEFTRQQLKLQHEYDSLYAEAVQTKLVQSEAQKKREDLFREAIARGDSLFTAGNFAEAILAYSEARSQKPFDAFARDKIRELGKLMEDARSGPAELLKKQIAAARNELLLHDYEDALEGFQIALKLAPEDSSIRKEINRLGGILRKRDERQALYIGGSTRLALKAFSNESDQNKENPDFFFERGRCYQHAGENKKAISDYSKAIEMDKNYKPAYQFRAEAFEKTKQFPLAIADYSTLTTMDPSNPEYLLSKAKVMIKNKDPEGAFKSLDQAIVLQPENPQFLTEKAALLRQTKNQDEALQFADKAIAARSGYPLAHYERGLVLIDQNEDKEATSSLLKARRLGLGKEQTDFLDALAVAEEKKAIQANLKNAKEDAVRYLKKSLVFRPNYPPVLLQLAELHQNLEQAKEGLLAVNQAIFYKPDYAAAHLLKGNLLLSSAGADASLESYYKARRYDPKNALNCVGLGNSYSRLNKLDSALHWYSEAIKLKPDLGQAYLQRGICHFRKENYSRATQDLETAIRKDGKLSEARFFMGMVKKAYNRFDEAVDDFKEAEDDGYNPYLCHVETGICYEKQDKQSKARKFYSEAIKLNPDMAQAYLLRGMSHLKDDNRKEAFADLDEGLKIDTAMDRMDYPVEFGFLCIEFGNAEKGEDFFRKALARDAFLVKANFGYGLCLFNRGEVVLGMTFIEQAFIPKKLTMSDLKKLPGTKNLLKNKVFKELKNQYLD